MDVLRFVKLLLEWTALVDIINFHLCHCCQHVIPDISQFSHSVYLKLRRNLQKRSLHENFRIHLSYDISLKNLTKEKQNFIKERLLPKAIRFWEETLSVKKYHSNIKILRQCTSEKVRYKDNDSRPFCVDGCSESTFCGDVQVPDHHIDACRHVDSSGDFDIIGESGEGVSNADFILYVSSLSLPRCQVENTVAYAAYCRLESMLDRPVAGYVNLCPEGISMRSFDEHQMYFTIKHEILHALGFSSGLFAFYRDGNGKPLTPRSPATNKPPYDHENRRYQWSSNVVKTILRSDWLVKNGTINKSVNIVVTPAVVREVRSHFNCSSIEGAELEDQGMPGTSMTHWEKRVFENEVMTGTYTQNLVISRITLALMEDTGWYKVKYEKAGNFEWGRNLGCGFVEGSCLDWMKSRKSRNESIHPFCERVKSRSIQTECNQDASAVALCNLITYEEHLPIEYQHFQDIPGIPAEDVTLHGGSVALADYCPYVQEFNWKKDEVVVRGSRCSIDANNPASEENYLVESYGTDSMCFEHSSEWSVQYCGTMHHVESWGSGCYKFFCDKNGLVVNITNHLYRCSRAGEIIKVDVLSDDWLHRGAIVCPTAPFDCPNFSINSFNVEERTKPLQAPCSNNLNFIFCGVHYNLCVVIFIHLCLQFI